ncbi:MAG: outer membrane beta-barrel protein [Bacteroidia bacterium]|nr:outer membrane beta-barrel protein [Bacteroidia bacterium]
MQRILFISVLSFWMSLPALRAQEAGADNLGTDRPRSFSLVLSRGVMLTGPVRDTVPVNGGSSGSYGLHAGIKLGILRNVLGLRIAPGISWTRIQYDQTKIKTFPTVVDSLPFPLSSERHHTTFLELPVGVYVNLTRDEDGDARFFLEGGGYVGYLLAASYRQRYTNSDQLTVRYKLSDLESLEEPEFSRLRYGVYARFGYKWASLHGMWRLSDVFDEFTNASLLPKEAEGFRNPKIPPLEAGLTIFF